MFKMKRKPSDILENLETKFYVSSRNKSLFEYLVNGPECPNEQNLLLRKRLCINEFEDRLTKL